MSTHDPSLDAAAMDAPLTNFSQCHVGITHQLQVLADLPALLKPAARARRLARESAAFFGGAVHEHHAEDERERFAAVLAAAKRGSKRKQVQVIVDRLVAEHRQIQAMGSRLEPALRALAKGQDAAAVQRLVDTYFGHAHDEEQEFLPLSQTLLGRDSNHMAALGISLHMRYSVPAML